ncbi:putative uncharacterized protein DDB_G0282133 [Octopus bimaculoides]|uniref:putative uncharacterized protein DDB_G0282133 n=1 Tax=Octopus bimaculoides TaxID=37653 RepID=UPI0022E176B3|nr:putative uncharacterized protein DDB_G0282133 [Octopus bimaculoides]
MGAPDSAQISDLVGIYLLSYIQKEFPDLEGGLYRDDALFVIKNPSNRKLELIKKNLHKFFKRFGLAISIENEHTSINYLDANCNLATGLHEPYIKPNTNLKYINASSNHPLFLKRGLAHSISNRISCLSSSQAIFNKHKETYNIALHKAGFNHKIKFMESNNHKKDPTTRNSNARNTHTTNTPNTAGNHTNDMNDKDKQNTCNRNTTRPKAKPHNTKNTNNNVNTNTNNIKRTIKANNETKQKYNNHLNRTNIKQYNDKFSINYRETQKTKRNHISGPQTTNNTNRENNERTHIKNKPKYRNKLDSRKEKFTSLPSYDGSFCTKYGHNSSKNNKDTIWLIIPYNMGLKSNIVRSLVNIIR